MWVVKLGGSLLGTPELKLWLDVLTSRSDGRIVIVPGGGVFADIVRSTQAIVGYDDTAAHRMALLAMEQYGLVMKSLRPDLVLASSELEIAERSWQHRAIAWMPSRMALADEAIPMSWDVTSDSLAAWLAYKIGADRLILVKHITDTGLCGSIRCLVADGVLDTAFPEFAKRLSCPICVFGKSEHTAFARVLEGGIAPAALAP